MKNWIKYSFLVLPAVALLCSCDGKEKLDYEPGGSGSATGTLSLKPALNVITKAVATDNFILKVYKAGTNEIAKDINNKEVVYTASTVPAIITLPVGSYETGAYSHVLTGAAWDKPYYEGKSDPFEIKQSKLTEAGSITCTLQNVWVTVKYTPLLLSELADFKVIVSNGTSNLEFLRGTTSDGYFTGTSLSVTLNGTRHDGETVNYSQSYTVNAGEHRTITLDVELKDDVTGSLRGTLLVNMNTKVFNVNLNVPVTEPEITDPTDPENPDPMELPLIKGRGFDIKQAVDYAVSDGATVIVDFEAEAGIKDLWVEIQSAFIESDPAFAILKTFNLADLSPELKEALGPDGDGLGLVGNDPIRDSKSLVFDISRFTAFLPAGTHSFVLTLKDNNNKTVTETLTLKPH